MTDLWPLRKEEIDAIVTVTEQSFSCVDYEFEICNGAEYIIATFRAGECEGSRIVIPYRSIQFLELSPAGMDVKGQPL